MARKNKALVGIAGSHFVAAELSQRGYIATVTSRNTKGIDVLASSFDGSKSVSVQVKTTTGPPMKEHPKRIIGWILNKKDESNYSDNLFYVLVYLKSPKDRPEYYIIPSRIVASYISARYQQLLQEPGRNGRKRAETDIRIFDMNDDELSKYLNNWEGLGLQT
jgi:hypothetical protein